MVGFSIKDHLTSIFTAIISVVFPASADVPCIVCHFEPSAVGNLVFWATARVGDKELSFFICITMLTELSTHGIVGTRYKNLVPLRWTGRFIRVTLT